MEVAEIKEALIEQRKLGLTGNLYYRNQLDFAYNTNHLEGSTISADETATIYDSGTILSDGKKVIVLKDANETKNHFILFNYMIDTLDLPLSEELIKYYHFLLKSGTLSEEERKWFNVGEYKKVGNTIGVMETTSPENVSKEIKALIEEYQAKKEIKLEDIIDFHARFELIHPFQDGNGRIGRIIMFKECLKNNIMPFIIESRNKSYYIRGLKEYQTGGQKGYLIDTCLNSQDNYEKLAEIYLRKAR